MDGAGGQRETASSRTLSRTSTPGSNSHRHRHAHCVSSNPPTPQLSSFLQERIQQRRAEKKISEGTLSSSTARSRDGDHTVQSSPIRRSITAMAQRAQSNVDDDGLDGMGIKEIEKTIETLKKQNWDLKLELYHRRERQTTLEEQTKRMQDEHASMLTQRNETMKLYDDLVQELDSRDRAVFEAIDMIVDLQSTVTGLEREKGMVRMVEADLRGSSAIAHANGFPSQTSNKHSSKPQTSNQVSGRLGDEKTLERMSSFLSERGERTANLRDMVLNNKTSLFHMRKVSEASADPSEANRNASPSLSVLSESSFMSVYGKNKTISDHMPSPPELKEPVASSRRPRPELSNENISSRVSDRVPGHRPMVASPGGASHLVAQMQPVNNNFDVNSQLRYMERLEGKDSVDSTSRRSASSQGKTTNAPVPARYPSQVSTKQEKRESLRRVITSSPDANDLANARMLPPTPDTTSSSMLRRHQNSNDTLQRDPRPMPQDGSANDIQALPAAALLPRFSPKLAQGSFSHSVPLSVITGRIKLLGPFLATNSSANFSQSPHELAQRPRSADDTTISHHRANSWDPDSDSDSEGGADAHSEASDLDYWMRESNMPDGQIADNRDSPDLFSFPAESGRWETDAIFGAMRGQGFMGSPAPDLRRDPTDEMSIRLIAPRNGIYHAPDPEARDGGIDAHPARRSSRSARTGSMTGHSIRPEYGNPKNSASRSGRPRSNSIDSATARAPVHGVRAGYQTDGAGVVRKSQYPPITGQPTRQRKSNALNRLFRRSISSNQDTQESATESRFSVEQSQPVQASIRRDPSTGQSSVLPLITMPRRAPPAVLDDHLTSATPPPIMRSRAPSAATKLDRSSDVQTTLRFVDDGEPAVDHQDQAVGDGSATNTPQNVRRKWLGLGRRSSLMSRNA